MFAYLEHFLLTLLFLSFRNFTVGVCPDSCNGHGTCSTIKDLSLVRGPDYDNTLVNAGDGVGPSYSNWDADSLQLCDCDSGFFGADCSLSESKCPVTTCLFSTYFIPFPFVYICLLS